MRGVDLRTYTVQSSTRACAWSGRVCVCCVFVPSSHRKQPAGPVVLSLVGPLQRDAGVGEVQASAAAQPVYACSRRLAVGNVLTGMSKLLCVWLDRAQYELLAETHWQCTSVPETHITPALESKLW
jgi:hypothetical protein